LQGLLAYPLCAAGGALAWWIGLPVPWLAGSMVVAAVLALGGLPISQAKAPITALLILVGTQIGANVTWETIGRMLTWPATLAVLVVTLAGVLVVTQLFYHRVLRWDPMTAFFSANPGALALTLALAEKHGARTERVAVVHCLRLFFLVACLPLLVTGVGHNDAGAMSSGVTVSLPGFVVALLAATAVGLALERLGVPGGAMIGAMIASAALHLGDLVHGALPNWVMVPCFVVLGMLAGSRFQGTRPVDLMRLAAAATSGFVVTVAVCGIGAVVAMLLSGLPITLLLLAFAPGAIEVMVILAFALNLDATFVAVHVVFRFIVLSAALPFLVAWLRRRSGED
jgi:membrane AbrB-like protein